ncbi:flagellar basal-body MS-ring/collar protein FliF [Candidatus Poribacteria bacterium]
MRESIVQSIRSSFYHRWGNLPAARKLTIGLIAAAVIAGIVGIAMWSSKPDYSVLFSDLSPDDMQAVEGELRSAGIPFQQSANGSSIMVPSSDVYKMRLRLANKGIPEAGNIGFEGFDKTDFGMTDFVQQLKYQRALQVELGRTIAQIRQVGAARVHIVLPRKTVFTERDEPAKASVFLTLRPGSRLGMGQVDGIVHLVAGAVEGLQKEDVTVLDTSGKMLSAPGREAVVDSSQLKYQRDVESELASRLQGMLDPVLGHNKAVVQVAAEIDFTSIETTSEVYSPDDIAPRTETSTDYTTKGAGISSTASGTPGVTSGITPGAAPPAGGWPEYNRSDTTTEYEVSKTVKHSIDRPGKVTKLSVAVVVDNKMVNETPTPWTPQELKEVEDLVGTAVGIDVSRDDIKVTNIPFDTSIYDEMADAEKMLKRDRLQNMIMKAGIAVVVFAFLIFILRSVLKRSLPDDTLALPESAVSVSESAERAMPLESAAPSALAAGGGVPLQEATVRRQPEPVAVERPVELSQAARDRQALLELLRSDPEMIARAIRTWMAE